MKMVLNLFSVGVLLAGCATAGERAPGAAEPAVRVERESYLMGTRLRAVVAGPAREPVLAAAEAAFAEVRRLEGVLTSWSAESEVGRLNAAPVGDPVPVTPELWALLEEAWSWSEATGAAFDPGLGALVDAWDLRGAGRRPSPVELERALEAVGVGKWRVDPDAQTLARPVEAAWLDTGGFGKGVALRAAERVLRRAGMPAAYLDFGGQLLVYGAPPGGEVGWEVAVAHPERRSEPAFRLWVREGSVSTSAQSERFVEVAGARLGHVLDPRDGRPVPAWGSVTVVARDPVAADVLSTALLVMGPETGRKWAAGRSDAGVLFLEVREGELVASWNGAFEQYREP